MVAVLHRRIGRTIGANAGRSLGAALLVMVGSFYFVAATGISGRLEDMVVGFATGHRQEDLSFSTDRPLEGVKALEVEAGASLEAQRQVDVEVRGGELRLFSAEMTINRPALLSGRGLQGDGEVLVDPSFLKVHGLTIGGPLELGGRTFRIAGTVAIPHSVYVIKNLHDVLPAPGFGIGVVSLADLETFPNVGTVYAAKFERQEELRAQSSRLRELLSARGYSPSEWLEASNNRRIMMPWGNISGMKSMSLPVSLVFFLLSCLIVGVMIVRVVTLDSAVIGTLYALGHRRGELTRHYLATPLLVSAAGALAGALLALPCVGPVVASMQTSYILPDGNADPDVASFALAVLLPSVLSGLISAVAIRGTLRKTAVELMKGDAQGTKANFIERALRLDRLGFDARFQIREQVRSIPRLVFLLVGATIASATLLYGFTYHHSMQLVTRQGALARYRYPIEYFFKQPRNLETGVLPTGAEPYNALRAQAEGRPSVAFYVIGALPNSVGLRMNDLEGRAMSRTQVNISAPLATRLGVREGDTIRFNDKQTGRAYGLTIDGIVEAYGEQFVFMPFDEFNLMTGQRAGSYRVVLSERMLGFDENELSGLMDARNPAAFEDLSAPTTLIVTSVTGIAVLIAIIIIALVTSLRVDESRATIALLKVLGYRQKELTKLVLGGSVLGVVAGFCFGLPLMLAFGNFIADSVAETINMLVPMVVNPLHVLVSFVLILAVHELTTRLSGRKLAKIPMSESLKHGSE